MYVAAYTSRLSNTSWHISWYFLWSVPERRSNCTWHRLGSCLHREMLRETWGNLQNSVLPFISRSVGNRLETTRTASLAIASRGRWVRISQELFLTWRPFRFALPVRGKSWPDFFLGEGSDDGEMFGNPLLPVESGSSPMTKCGLIPRGLWIFRSRIASSSAVNRGSLKESVFDDHAWCFWGKDSPILLVTPPVNPFMGFLGVLTVTGRESSGIAAWKLGSVGTRGKRWPAMGPVSI